MDYTKHRITAAVDYADVLIRTVYIVGFEDVQRAFGRALKLPFGKVQYVRAIDALDTGETTTFIVRIHDVKRYSDIEKMLALVGEQIGIVQGFDIVKIEIAIDAKCDDMPKQAADFYKHMTHIVSDNRRIYRDIKGFVLAVPDHHASLVRHIKDGWQIGIGNRSDDEYQHIYYKTTDDNGLRLPETHHTARIETTLTGAALPCNGDDWRRFKFETLAHCFRFTKIKDGLPKLLQVQADKVTQIGERRTRNRREGGTRLYSKVTQADTALNTLTREALRKLSKRWAATGRQGMTAMAK